MQVPRVASVRGNEHGQLQLKLWELYSLDGADEPETMDEMKQYFERHRPTRDNTTNHAYWYDALKRS